MSPPVTRPHVGPARVRISRADPGRRGCQCCGALPRGSAFIVLNGPPQPAGTPVPAIHRVLFVILCPECQDTLAEALEAFRLQEVVR